MQIVFKYIKPVPDTSGIKYYIENFNNKLIDPCSKSSKLAYAVMQGEWYQIKYENNRIYILVDDSAVDITDEMPKMFKLYIGDVQDLKKDHIIFQEDFFVVRNPEDADVTFEVFLGMLQTKRKRDKSVPKSVEKSTRKRKIDLNINAKEKNCLE